jgi:hypothetical protein
MKKKVPRLKTDRQIALVVLGKGRWSIIKPHVAQVVAAVNAATPGNALNSG